MNTPFNLKDRCIWVTGGAGYLGSAITIALDAAGAQVLCIDLPGKAEALVRRHSLNNTTATDLDVNAATTLPQALEALMQTHGTPQGLVHLSYASTAGKHLTEISAQDFGHTLEQALPSTFVLCRTLADAMAKKQGGSIVLFASMYGIVAPDPSIYVSPMTPNPIDYGTSKAALIQMARYLSIHYGRRAVRINSISPGPFPNASGKPEMEPFIRRLEAKTALGRVGTNTEIVAPALFLLSEGASFVTGHNLVVDGGWTAW